MTAQTARERKAKERKRRRDAGEVLVQVWVKKEVAEKVKAAIARCVNKYGT